ncbi:MAG TPA: HU family DNA-binding protein [candidate division Zixibacteria bacterium]|nr:HU family DNA-binding protein [candidate division Zixibacteria bacterium]
MTKDEFVAKVADQTGMSKAQVNKALKATLGTITDALKKGDKISFVGFGTFSTSKRAKRIGRNPKTGEKMNIPATTVAKFKPGKNLKDSVK